MAIHRSSIGVVVVSIGLLGLGYWVASRIGYLESMQARLLPKPRPKVKLSSGDFPAGVSAPLGDIASVPLRPTLIGFTPRGSSAALLLATGGIRSADLGSRERVF